MSRILTHHAAHMPDPCWSALDMDAACDLLKGYNLTDEEKNSLPAIMAGYCRIIDFDYGILGIGNTKEEAIQDAKDKVARYEVKDEGKEASK